MGLRNGPHQYDTTQLKGLSQWSARIDAFTEEWANEQEDHEVRIRCLEKKAWRWAGIGGAVGSFLATAVSGGILLAILSKAGVFNLQ